MAIDSKIVTQEGLNYTVQKLAGETIGNHNEIFNDYNNKIEGNGEYCHVEGVGTKATGTAQHVEGKYNVIPSGPNYLHIVGNGSKDSPSNAYTLDEDGNGWFANGVTAKNIKIGDEKITTIDENRIYTQDGEINARTLIVREGGISTDFNINAGTVTAGSFQTSQQDFSVYGEGILKANTGTFSGALIANSGIEVSNGLTVNSGDITLNGGSIALNKGNITLVEGDVLKDNKPINSIIKEIKLEKFVNEDSQKAEFFLTLIEDSREDPITLLEEEDNRKLVSIDFLIYTQYKHTPIEGNVSWGPIQGDTYSLSMISFHKLIKLLSEDENNYTDSENPRSWNFSFNNSNHCIKLRYYKNINDTLSNSSFKVHLIPAYPGNASEVTQPMEAYAYLKYE